MIDVLPEHLKIIIDILKRFVPSFEVRAFGSRCKGKSKKYSDLDLAIVGNEKIDSNTILEIKEAFEESNLPYRVDVLDWNAISENFRKIINEKYEVIQKIQDNFDDEKGLPDGWNKLYVKDFANVNEATIDKKYKFEEIKYIDIASVENRQIIEFQNYTLSNAPSRAKRIVKRNDILISTVRPNLKHFTILKNVSCNTIASTGFAVITAKKIDPYFLYYSLTTDEFTNYLSRIADSHTSTYPSFNPDIIENAIISVPPENEQKSIASILSSLDDKIELNRKMNETLEKISQAIFKHWFIDFEFPGENGKPYKSSGGKMVETELGEIPEKWKFGKLGNIIELAYGKALKSDDRVNGIYPVIGSSGIVGYHNNFLVQGPGIVIGRKGTIGEVIWVDNNFFPIDTTFYVKDTLGVSGLFYHYFTLKEQEFKKISSDSAVPGLNRNQAMENDAIIPSTTIIEKFNMIVQSLFKRKFLIVNENNSLTDIRDNLLPKLMSGKIRVKV
jgi:type I restriction enzyme S subunit